MQEKEFEYREFEYRKRSSNTGKGVRIQRKEFDYREWISNTGKGVRIQEKEFEHRKRSSNTGKRVQIEEKEFEYFEYKKRSSNTAIQEKRLMMCLRARQSTFIFFDPPRRTSDRIIDNISYPTQITGPKIIIRQSKVDTSYFPFLI
jgi:hypothetical protein